MGENICLFLQRHSCRTDTSVWFPFLTGFLLLIQLIVQQSLEQGKSVIKIVLLCTIIFCIFNSASLLIKKNYPCFCHLIFSKTNNELVSISRWVWRYGNRIWGFCRFPGCIYPFHPNLDFVFCLLLVNEIREWSYWN